jgi:hypothetical protein
MEVYNVVDVPDILCCWMCYVQGFVYEFVQMLEYELIEINRDVLHYKASTYEHL